MTFPLSVLFLGVSAAMAAAQVPRPPNVVVMMTDDGRREDRNGIGLTLINSLQERRKS